MQLIKTLVVVATALVSLSSSVLAAGEPKVNAFRTPGASGICKNTGQLKKLRLAVADGTQIRSGFCSSQTQGQIPNTDHMVSSFITFPKNEGKVIAEKNFTAVVKVANLRTGNFGDPTKDYYDQPQQLDDNGNIIGHSHITIQKLNGDKVLDPRVFTFFKGLNLKAQGGALTQIVNLPPGKYRMCCMSSAFTHQPVIMPVAQRGAQDDCVRFTAVKKR